MGAIGLDDGMKLFVSTSENGTHMIDQLFWDFAGKTIRLPKIAEHYPLDKFVEWHRGRCLRGETYS